MERARLKRTLLGLGCAAVLWLVALAGPALATTIPPLSMDELVTRSDLVAQGVVTAHTSAWVGRRILTFYEIDVVDRVRSAPGAAAPSHIVVAMPGGIVDGIGQSVAGTPVLEDGGRYLFCVSAAVGPRDARAVIGLWQGLWRVAPDGAVVGFNHDGPTPATTTLWALRAQLGAALGASLGAPPATEPAVVP